MTNVAAGDPKSPAPQLFIPAGWKGEGQPPLYTAAQVAALKTGNHEELAHELFAAAQLAPGEGIEDAVSRIAAALAAAPVVQAEQLHITHGPLMRHAAALLRSRKPVLPDHESVAAELELAVEGHPTPSGEPSAEWLEVMRIATTPAQPAAPQGVAYAELPDLFREALAWGMTYGPEIPAHQWEEMRESMVKQYTERASHGKAPAAQEHPWGCRANAFGACSCGQASAGAALFDEQGFRDWVLRNLPDDTIIGNGAWWAEHLTAWAKRFIKAAPTAQAAPAAGAVAGPWKDHQTREIVNQLRDCAREFHATQQLRERLLYVLGPMIDWMRAVQAPTPAAQADSVLEDAAQLAKITQAIRDYHFALDNREHGGVAMARAWNAICDVLNMDWVQGAESAAREQGAKHD